MTVCAFFRLWPEIQQTATSLRLPSLLGSLGQTALLSDKLPHQKHTIRSYPFHISTIDTFRPKKQVELVVYPTLNELIKFGEFADKRFRGSIKVLGSLGLREQIPSKTKLDLVLFDNQYKYFQLKDQIQQKSAVLTYFCSNKHIAQWGDRSERRKDICLNNNSRSGEDIKSILLQLSSKLQERQISVFGQRPKFELPKNVNYLTDIPQFKDYNLYLALQQCDSFIIDSWIQQTPVLATSKASLGFHLQSCYQEVYQKNMSSFFSVKPQLNKQQQEGIRKVTDFYNGTTNNAQLTFGGQTFQREELVEKAVLMLSRKPLFYNSAIRRTLIKKFSSLVNDRLSQNLLQTMRLEKQRQLLNKLQRRKRIL